MSPAEEVPEDVGDVRCTFECDASSAEWKVVDATITEELNEPYHVSLALRTEDTDTDPTEMLGKPCNVIIERDDLSTQYPAIVHWIEDSAMGDRFVNISVEASAAFWMLSQSRQTRIFQDMAVPEILDEVLGDGLSPYDRKHDTDFGRDYPKCEYRVQYDESDFAFCERLMEEEGIIYRFDRAGSAEVMCLTDDPHGSVDVQSTEGKDIHFSAQRGVRECAQSFLRYSAMRPTKLAMRNFNWTRPSLLIEEEKKAETGGGPVDGSATGPDREIYEHDLCPPTLCDYKDDDGYQSNDAADQCQIRRELSARDKLVMHGHGTAIGFCAGGLFSLLDHSLEGDYLLTRVTHNIANGGGAASYSNHFVCLPAKTPYRPDRRTPKPRVTGIETATVVGPSGQEIHTDKHGRIKVQFHWDREGSNDDHSSCFIRVVQPWAGAGWGFVFIPRIGMEVTVAFVQGDPDRPIVTGTVYNGENPTSYAMPDEMTKSTIRTQSSPGGDGYNELTFEDKAGEEEVFLQAQKDLRETIKNKHTTSVGADQSLSVAANRSVTVDKNETIHIKGSQNITIDGSEDGDDVKGGKTSITGDYKLDTSNEIMVEAPTKITLTCGGSTIEMEPGKITLTAGDGAKLTLDANALMQSVAGAQIKLDPNVEATSVPGATMKLDANALMQSVPGAKVELSANASILAPVNAEITAGVNADINATNASMTGAAQAKVTGAAAAELTGGGQAKVTGGMVSVTGGIVSIN